VAARHNPMHASQRMRRNASAAMRASAGFGPLPTLGEDGSFRTGPTAASAHSLHSTNCAIRAPAQPIESLSRPIVVLRLCRQSTVPTVIACAAVLSGKVPTVNRVPHASAKPLIA
jgi:hypothetical protein